MNKRKPNINQSCLIRSCKLKDFPIEQKIEKEYRESVVKGVVQRQSLKVSEGKTKETLMKR